MNGPEPGAVIVDALAFQGASLTTLLHHQLLRGAGGEQSQKLAHLGGLANARDLK